MVWVSGVGNPILNTTSSGAIALTNASGDSFISVQGGRDGRVYVFNAHVDTTSITGGTFGGTVTIELRKNGTLLAIKTLDGGSSGGDLNTIGAKFVDNLGLLAGTQVNSRDLFELIILNNFTGTSIFNMTLIMNLTVKPRIEAGLS